MQPRSDRHQRALGRGDRGGRGAALGLTRVVGALAVILLLVGCGDKRLDPSEVSTGAVGRTMIAVGCVAGADGATPSCTNRPVIAHVVFVAPGTSGPVIGEADTQSDGTFAVPLPPGSYEVTGSSPLSRRPLDKVAVTVVDGQVVDLTLVFNTLAPLEPSP